MRDKDKDPTRKGDRHIGSSRWLATSRVTTLSAAVSGLSSICRDTRRTIYGGDRGTYQSIAESFVNNGLNSCEARRNATKTMRSRNGS